MQKIYDIMPYFIKVMLVNSKALINKFKRYNKLYNPVYDQLVLNDNLSYEEVKNYQSKMLKKLLLECYNHTVYYREIFDKYHTSETDIQNDPFAVLKKMPFLSKDTRKQRVNDIVNTNPSRKVIDVTYTSGTTGTPMINYIDKETSARSFALWNRFHNRIGINRRNKNARFSYNKIVSPTNKSKKFWIHNYIDNQLFFSIYHMYDNKIKFYIEKLNRYKPIYLDGSPSAIYTIANYINNNNSILSFKPLAVCTTAETLFDYQRDEIEKAFQCKVYNQYASSEGSPFITECHKGQMHMEEDSGVFEILDDNDLPIKKGVGRLVVTSLQNWKTPLIRYNILDFVEIDNEITCDCGSPFKTVKAIAGRANDLFWHPSKGYSRATISSVVKNYTQIKQIQIVQIEPEIVNVYIQLYDNNLNNNYKIEKNIIENLKATISEAIVVNFFYDKYNTNSKKSRFIIRDFDINIYKR